jgi:hypothetical protein
VRDRRNGCNGRNGRSIRARWAEVEDAGAGRTDGRWRAAGLENDRRDMAKNLLAGGKTLERCGN